LNKMKNVDVVLKVRVYNFRASGSVLINKLGSLNSIQVILHQKIESEAKLLFRIILNPRSIISVLVLEI